MTTDLLGYIAAFLTTTSFLPQVIRTLRTGDTRSISFTMYLMLVIGVAAWLAYGWLLGALPIMLANGITLLLASIILVMKWRELRREQQA
ncbi:SemiSWEET transporter [Vogesella urethralis]|jgi:MtN3 and saliva related transmembrane protein|uniref:SemiSWEET transporter n=1 Tax=Vogesella urethralis TaxID=2592656 RepID=UPI001185E8A2|nr:SemiSWEET transporter [Vogesella urethralis]MEC5207086.1 MtN3 and saliva related transmembrane protein [Vogesella perlucida]